MDNATPSLPAILENTRSLDSSALNKLFETTIPQSRTPFEYLEQLDEKDRLTARRACPLSWFATGEIQVPREIVQLPSCLATFNSKDSLLYAGTGSGKTLPIALNLLLEDPAKKLITLTISPLKRLQITQVYYKSTSGDSGPKPCTQNRKGPQCNQTESTWCGGMKPKYITHRGERNGTNATGRRDH